MMSAILGIVCTAALTYNIFILQGFDNRLSRIEKLLMSRRKTDEPVPDFGD